MVSSKTEGAVAVACSDFVRPEMAHQLSPPSPRLWRNRKVALDTRNSKRGSGNGHPGPNKIVTKDAERDSAQENGGRESIGPLGALRED
jgi:hypothetical protein